MMNLNDIEITQELLLDNDWSNILDFNKAYQCTKVFEKTVLNIGKMSLTYDSYGTNSVGRNWVLHIDNDRMESVGNCDVQTVEHINLMCKIFNIDINDFI